MKVISIEEQVDGSAILNLELSKEENQIFLEYAITDMLRKGIESMKEEDIDHEIQRSS